MKREALPQLRLGLSCFNIVVYFLLVFEVLISDEHYSFCNSMSMEPTELKFAFKLLNWNVRGLGDLNKCMVIKNSVLDLNCDLFCFQETKWNDHSIFKVRQVCSAKFKSYITLDAEGSRGGILLAWSNSYKLLNSYIMSYSVSAILQRGDFIFMISGTYGPQPDNDKMSYLAELRELRALNDLLWILMGDFNIHRSQQDTTGGPINFGIVSEFNNTIHELDLLDVPLIGRKFTWSNKRPTPTFSRLDRIFISPHWNSMGASYELQDAPSTASDHTPLLLNVRPHFNNRRGSFKFENYWLRHPQINDLVQNVWGEATETQLDPIKTFHLKIKKTAEALHRWAQVTYRSKDTYLTRSMWVIQRLDRAEESRILNSLEFMLRIRLRENVFKLSKEKEEKWKQRSGATWLKLGDNNTRYFHAVTNGRKNQNFISAIRCGNTTYRDQIQIEQALFNHYQSLIGSPPSQNRAFNLSGKIGPQLAGQLAYLDAEITTEEIKEAVFQLPKGKACGPDGMPAEFYQHF